ncbi:SDR family NAD(P)-dependent oxidoreductase [Streptomyces canus]|uniref:SDR family NAD(P)-dependent oxidoreductase n=1 Tax=Streptomyces canus TaxID=58343 RepID=UPI003409FB51
MPADPPVGAGHPGDGVFRSSVRRRRSTASSICCARNGGGAVVNILSAASWFTYPGSSSYAVSKAPQWKFTNGIRLELRAQETTVTGVHVGMVDTDMTAALDVEKIDPAEFVRIVLDGVKRGQSEIVADDLSRRAKAALAHEPSLLVP